MRPITSIALKNILRDFEIHTQNFFTFQGNEYYINDQLEQIHKRKTKSGILASQIANCIYLYYHCKQSIEQGSFFLEDKNYIQLLSQANVGKGSKEYGWMIKKNYGNDYMVVEKDNLKLWVNKKNYLPENLKIGEKIYINLPKESRNLIPGFYVINGNVPIKNEYDIRIYWNLLDRNSGIKLTKLVTTAFNEKNIPFRMKILSNPNKFIRTDSAVIYTDKQSISKLKTILFFIYDNIKNLLNNDTSVFTKRLAPGLSLAEDPKNGESFGLNRSKMLAEFLINIHKRTIREK